MQPPPLPFQPMGTYNFYDASQEPSCDFELTGGFFEKGVFVAADGWEEGLGEKNGSTIDLCCLGGIDHLYIVFLSLAGTAPIAQLWTVGRQEGATETIQIQIHIQRLHQPSNGKIVVFQIT